jgi:hypothetical protein
MKELKNNINSIFFSHLYPSALHSSYRTISNSAEIPMDKWLQGVRTIPDLMKAAILYATARNGTSVAAGNTINN